MESKFDWLTLTLKPESPKVTFEDCFKLLGDKMLLTDLFAKMVPVPRVAHYDWCVGYENITLCCPSNDRFYKQGICLRISSQGLDYLTRYLATYFVSLKQWLGAFRHLCFEGYASYCTRLDYAMDDIHYDGEKPFITMKKVMDCSVKGELCKKARVVDLYDGDGVAVRKRFKIVNKEPVVGRTLYLGSRKSEVSCRFYDKLAEQLQKKQPIPENCTSWTRCEFELKDGAAMSALNAFLDYDDVDFGKHMRGVVNNYCSFIVRNNENISRCPIKRWWAKFLGGCTEKFKLPHKKPSRSAYARAKRGLIQYMAILYTMAKEIGVKGVYGFFKEEIDKKLLCDPNAEIYKKELAENIREDNNDFEEMTAFKRYFYNSLVSEDVFKKNCYEQYCEFRQLHYGANHMNKFDKQRHQNFMNGYEVLYDGV